MAVTFESIPQYYAPSDNPLTYVFSSTHFAQPNFSFKVSVVLGGVTISEDRVFVEVDTDTAHFDAAPYVRNAMNSPRFTSALLTDMDTMQTLKLTVVESYGTPATDQSTLDSSTTFTFKSRVINSLWESTTFLTDYAGVKWLTNHPTNDQFILRGTDVFASMLYNGTTTYSITFYDSSGSSLYIHSATTGGFRLMQFNLSDTNLAAVYADPGVYADVVSYFTIQVNTSEIYTFRYLDDYCFGVWQLTWINEFGALDQFVVTHNLINEASVESQSYKRQYGRWNGTSFEYSLQDGSQLDYFKRVKDTGVLVTGYMTEQIQNWFIETYKSPRHYVSDVNGLLYPIKLTSSNYAKKQGQYEQLIMEEVKFEVSVNHTSLKL